MLISVIFFLFITLAIISGLVAPTIREFQISNNLIRSKQSFILSESGIEDAYFRLKNAKPIGAVTNITLLGNTATTTITDSAYNEKKITTLGNVSSRERKNELTLTTGTGVAFNYGIQAGTGGFIIGNAVVNGNVYSNGSIIGSNGATITGSAVSAEATGFIDNVDVGQSGIGDIRAHNVINSTVSGNLYCQTGSGNNKPCDTTQTDPVTVEMPITQVMVDKWKADATAGGTVSGNVIITTPTTLGPVKITGNLTINNDLVIADTIYVVGNISTNNNAHISLSSSYVNAGGIIVTDGRVVLSNNVQFITGNATVYVLMVTTSTCPVGCSGLNALEILNNVGAILVNAQNGTVHLNNNVQLSEVVGKTIIIDNSATINYTLGLVNGSFNSGPSGGWNIRSWKEIE